MKKSEYEEHFKAFLKVRDTLAERKETWALVRCYHKPVKFYGEHSLEEAIKILKAEAAGEEITE